MARKVCLAVRILQRKSWVGLFQVGFYFFSIFLIVKSLRCIIALTLNGVGKMGEKEGTKEGSLDGMITPGTNNLEGEAMKMFGADGIIVRCHYETEGARRNLGQVEENSLGKGGGIDFFLLGIFSRMCGRHFLELQQKSVRPAQKSQLSYNVKGKVEEIET